MELRGFNGGAPPQEALRATKASVFTVATDHDGFLLCSHILSCFGGWEDEFPEPVLRIKR